MGFSFLYNFFYCCSSTVVSIFSPPQPTPQPFAPPTLNPTHFGFVNGPFIHIPWEPFPYFIPLSLSPLLSGHCQFVLHFNVSASIFLACLFSWLDSTHRWDHMVFVFHCLAYFLNFDMNLKHRSCFKKIQMSILHSYLLHRSDRLSVFDKPFMLYSCTPNLEATTDCCTE